MPEQQPITRADRLAAIDLYQKALNGTVLQIASRISIARSYVGEWDRTEDFVEYKCQCALKKIEEAPEHLQKYFKCEREIRSDVEEYYDDHLIMLARSVFYLGTSFNYNWKTVAKIMSNIECCDTDYY